MADADPPRGIACPACGCVVLDVTRTVRVTGSKVRRYRKCRNCGRTVTTMEAPPAVLRNLFPRLFDPPANTSFH